MFAGSIVLEQVFCTKVVCMGSLVFRAAGDGDLVAACAGEVGAALPGLGGDVGVVVVFDGAGLYDAVE